MYDICNLISVLTSSISDESQPLRIKSMQNKLNWISFVLELDRMLGDTMVEIVDYESRILLKLVQFIQERTAPLYKLIKLASELDW